MNKKYLKGLLSLSLSGLMAASLAAPVFADTNTNPTDTTTTTTTDTNTNPTDAKAYITKQFDMPVGTTRPDETFTFNEGTISKDGKPSTVTLGDKEVNNLGNKDVTIGRDSTKKTIEVNGAGNEHKIYRYLASTPLLTDADETALKNAGAGVYTFPITESHPASGYVTPGTTPDGTKDTKLTYSQAEYEATVYVKTGANGNYIGTIKVSKEKDDQGHAITTENEKKVDPSQPDDNIPGSGGLRFVNTYTEKFKDAGTTPGKVNPDPTNPTNPDNDRDKVLSVGKIVSGDLGEKNKPFQFTVKVTRPSLVTSTDETLKDETYNAEVINAKGKTVGDGLTFNSGEAKTVNLSHGEKLVFKDLYVGTAFEAQETDGDTTYTSSTYARLNGGDPTEKAKERALVKGNVSENTDTVVVVNTRNSTSPTGIVVNNLPYILLVLGVVAGFAGYIASKRRREVR